MGDHPHRHIISTRVGGDCTSGPGESGGHEVSSRRKECGAQPHHGRVWIEIHLSYMAGRSLSAQWCCGGPTWSGLGLVHHPLFGYRACPLIQSYGVPTCPNWWGSLRWRPYKVVGHMPLNRFVCICLALTWIPISFISSVILTWIPISYLVSYLSLSLSASHESYLITWIRYEWCKLAHILSGVVINKCLSNDASIVLGSSWRVIKIWWFSSYWGNEIMQNKLLLNENIKYFLNYFLEISSMISQFLLQ